MNKNNNDTYVTIEYTSMSISWNFITGRVIFTPKSIVDGSIDINAVISYTYRIPYAGENVFDLTKELIDLIDKNVFDSFALSTKPSTWY